MNNLCKRPSSSFGPPVSPEPEPSTARDIRNDDDSDNTSEEGDSSLSRATKEELFERVHRDLKAVMAAVTGPSSRLNKDSTNTVGAGVQDVLAVVATLSLRLSEAELKLAQANLRSKTLEHDALKARSELAIASIQSVAPSAAPSVFPTSYSTILRLPKKAEPVNIPAVSGPVLAFYPAPNQGDKLKSAEDTKAELKRAIKPQVLEVQVDRVRKVGNAGVVVQTSNPSAAERLRNAAPPSLRVSEPQKRQPRLCLRNLDGDPSEEFVFSVLFDQNLRGTDWTSDKIKDEAKIYKRRGRQADTTTVIIECSPALRDTLVRKEKLYLGWQAVEVHDHIGATCCHKCQQYGHPERYCRAVESTCGKCGASGHRKTECMETIERCATCHKFGRAEASHHSTASRACPARRYAEERAVANTNYGRP